MKAQPSQDDDATLFDEEMDDLEAWTPQDLDPFGNFGESRIADSSRPHEEIDESRSPAAFQPILDRMSTVR